jgi:hypothetical protein
MVWTKKPPRNLKNWHRVFAWLPIELNDGTNRVVWLEWVWRRDICPWPDNLFPEWGYRLYRDSQ